MESPGNMNSLTSFLLYSGERYRRMTLGSVDRVQEFWVDMCMLRRLFLLPTSQSVDFS